MGKIYNFGIVSPKGFDLSGAEPVDQREVVQYYTDLITLDNCYPGIEVKIEELSYKKYRLIAIPSSTLTNWVVVESGVGEQGPQGIQGVPGVDGESAYEIYLDNGGNLSEHDWLQSLYGPEGAQGDPGIQGPAGPPGPPGIGVPIGGTIGQVLAKLDDNSYSTGWIDVSQLTGAAMLTDSNIFVGATNTFKNIEVSTDLTFVNDSGDFIGKIEGYDYMGEQTLIIGSGSGILDSIDINAPEVTIRSYNSSVHALFKGNHEITFPEMTEVVVAAAGDKSAVYKKWVEDYVDTTGDPNAWKKTGTTVITTPTIEGDPLFDGDVVISGGLALGIGQQLTWNDAFKTLNIPTGTGSTLQAGQELYFFVHNATGVDIVNGQVLKPGGGTLVNGEVIPNVTLAQADTHSNCDGTLFFATSDIPNGAEGMATRFGRLSGVNTSAFAPGDNIYLSPTVLGGITPVRPVFPDYTIILGGILNVGVGDGVIANSVTRSVEDTVLSAWDGAFRESIDFLVTSDGTTTTGTLEQSGGGDITMIFSDGLTTLDCTPLLTIPLTHGTDTVPQLNFVYIPADTKVLTVNTVDWPVDEHIKVADLYLRSSATTQTDNAFCNRNWNDHIKSAGNNGHMLHITERLRQNPASWSSGAEGTVTVVGGADVWVSNTAGYAYQVHKQSFEAHDTQTGDDIHIINHPTTPFLGVSNLNTQDLDSLGVSLNNTSFSFVIWGIANKGTTTSHLSLNLPTGAYAFTVPSDAVEDASNKSVYDIPLEFNGKGFLIARATCTLKNGVWVLYDLEDLRGKFPNSVAGGGGGGGTGVSSFLGLEDVPSTYVGSGNKSVIVNVGETGLEFSTEELVTIGTTQAITGDKSFDGELRVTGNSALPWEGTLVPNLQYLWENYYSKAQTGVAGETLSAGDIVYQNDTLFTWFKASASILAHVTGKLGIVMTGNTVGNSVGISFDTMENGSGWTAKVPFYLGVTAGSTTETPPTGTDYVRVLGSNISTEYRYFNASNINYVKGDGTVVNGVTVSAGSDVALQSGTNTFTANNKFNETLYIADSAGLNMFGMYESGGDMRFSTYSGANYLWLGGTFTVNTSEIRLVPKVVLQSYIEGPLDPVVGNQIGDRDYNDARYDVLFKTPIISAGDYTTANQDIATKKTVKMTSGSTLTLSKTGLTEDFQQQLFNATGSDITITSVDGIEGEHIPLIDGAFVYYTLVDGSWLISVGGASLAEWAVAISDETTDLTTGTAKTTFRMPFAMNVTEVRASLTTASTGANVVVDINENGTSILSTKLSIDATEKTSTTAATAAVISDGTLVDDAEITIDIDVIGSTLAGAGLKVMLIGTR